MTSEQQSQISALIRIEDVQGFEFNKIHLPSLSTIDLSSDLPREEIDELALLYVTFGGLDPGAEFAVS